MVRGSGRYRAISINGIMFDLLKQHPVLLWSAGNDSTLLLSMMIEAKISFDIVQFGREFWTKKQKRRADELIRKWNLKVFSYPPKSTSFIGENGNISVVREYAFMGVMLPMISDVIEGDRCIADLDSYKAVAPPYQWDCVVIGSRQDDRHYAFKDQVVPAETWKSGETTFVAPLYKWTREEVVAELERRGLNFTATDQTDSGNLALCTKCLNGVEVLCPKENSIIEPVQWSAEFNLQQFRNAYS